MKDTIYREDVIKIIHHYFVDLIDSLTTITDFDGEENIEDLQKCNEYLEMNKTICGLISELPSAEPKIVYCKDCKHWYPDADCGMACEFTNMSQPEDGFCNWGVKKDG